MSNDKILKERYFFISKTFSNECMYIFVFQLLYFSATSNAQEGFMRALSVSSGTHMPRLLKPLTKADSVINRFVLFDCFNSSFNYVMAILTCPRQFYMQGYYNTYNFIHPAQSTNKSTKSSFMVILYTLQKVVYLADSV